MKRNKTLMLAALASACATLSLQAQNTNLPPATGTNPPPQIRPMPHTHADMFAARLKLSAEQAAKTKPIFEDMDKQILALPIPERRAKSMAIREDAVAKLKDILTDEQFNQCKLLLLGARRNQASGNFVPPGTMPAATNSAKPQP